MLPKKGTAEETSEVVFRKSPPKHKVSPSFKEIVVCKFLVLISLGLSPELLEEVFLSG